VPVGGDEADPTLVGGLHEHAVQVVPGFVDSHTHFVFFARTLGNVRLQEFDTIEGCLKEIERFAKKKKAGEWIVGEGYAPDRLKRRVEPTAAMLDEVTGNRPTFI